jgi:uncharacterized membrane protein YfcA
MSWTLLALAVFGIGVGVAASFSGLAGGFLMVPLLLLLGYPAQKSVGTCFFATVLIAISAVIAHIRLGHVDYRAGLLLGIGGVVGAQIGARFVDHVSTAEFKKIFAGILIALAVYLLCKN